MPEFLVGTTNDIAEGQRKIVEIEGRSIGVYNINKQYYALHNYCPHQGAPICEGKVCGTTEPSNVFEYLYDREGEILRCPWHGWEFDIKTGKSLFSDKVRSRSYQVVVKDEDIYLVL